MTGVIMSFYEEMVSKGVSPKLAEMLALQQPPGIRTDTTFLSGRGLNQQQAKGHPEIWEMYRKAALAAGVNPAGKVYLPSLASRRGDPEAWVSGRGDVLRVCRNRGWSVEGAVSYAAPETEIEEKPYRLADDIVEEHALNSLEKAGCENPTAADLAASMERTRERLTPHWT